jgi:hypothetical protein
MLETSSQYKGVNKATACSYRLGKPDRTNPLSICKQQGKSLL